MSEDDGDVKCGITERDGQVTVDWVLLTSVEQHALGRRRLHHTG